MNKLLNQLKLQVSINFFDNPAGAVSKNYGVGPLDIRFTKQLWGGLTALRRDLEVPFGTLELPEFYEIEQTQENYYNAYLYWMPNRQWAVSMSGFTKLLKLSKTCRAKSFYSQTSLLANDLLPINVQYFDPSGFFAGAGLVYVNQRINFLIQYHPPPLPMPHAK
ncbi:MAG: hypothetical protein H6976_12895 [Gammaproteobacteria bacterium]|nr:hypothetical protein [Gammaproteobacteria bacterium]